MPLKQRFKMHMRLQNGAMYAYDILDDGKVIGSKSEYLDKKKQTMTVTYTLGDKSYTTPSAFMRAYELQKRDAEFDAAAPKDNDHG